ncbi:hypothetical protein [Actinopolymorpha alba]|uniref:hypothetical protein n=1 Tax=Actinopolymorpha alba TaxID=533267 RepID=UPI00036F9B51|nr:hypothetical protein [Actinopolymorpha alba]
MTSDADPRRPDQPAPRIPEPASPDRPLREEPDDAAAAPVGDQAAADATLPDSEHPEHPERPERPPLNASGWVALVLATAAFGSSLLVAWAGAVMLAALGLALSITGLVRVYRGRATNGPAAATALALAIATIILGFVWADRAQECIPLARDNARFEQCYADRTGIL